MEDNEKVKILKAFREFIPYAIFVIGATVVKIAMYHSRSKKMPRSRMVFVTLSSLFIGTLTGAVCSMFQTNWLSYLAVSAATLASEGIIEVFVANSKNAVMMVWDKFIGLFLSWMDSFKKKKK